MEHKTLPGLGGRVHYWTAGQGVESIVFTHGATMDHDLFRPQMAFFSVDYRVITWDVPAHGRSRPYAGFSLQGTAVDLVSILDREQIEQAHLVGQSMGGYIAQLAALEHPQRVRTLTAVDSSPIQPGYYSALDNWLLEITPPLLRLYPYATLIKTIANQIALTSPARAYALETLQGYTKVEIAAIMRAVYRGLQQVRWEGKLPAPVLIVYGESDRTGKVRSYCEQWSQIEKRMLKVIPDAAHNANMDNPEEFNRILAEFLRAPR